MDFYGFGELVFLEYIKDVDRGWLTTMEGIGVDSSICGIKHPLVVLPKGGKNTWMWCVVV